MYNEMGNQQATSTILSNNENLAYLGGVIDGEGTISVNRTLTHQKTCYIPRLQIPNTNEGIINKICEIIDYYHIGSHIEKRIGRRKEHKDCYIITINGATKLVKLLPLIIPYLFGRKEQAKLVLRFCQSRLRNTQKNPQLIHNIDGTIKSVKRFDEYVKEEISLYEQIKLLNKKGKSFDGASQTLR